MDQASTHRHNESTSMCSPCSRPIRPCIHRTYHHQKTRLSCWHVQHEMSSISSSKNILSQTVRNRNTEQTIADDFPEEMIVVGMRVRAPKCVLRPAGGVEMCSNDSSIITFDL